MDLHLSRAGRLEALSSTVEMTAPETQEVTPAQQVPPNYRQQFHQESYKGKPSSGTAIRSLSHLRWKLHSGKKKKKIHAYDNFFFSTLS